MKRKRVLFVCTGNLQRSPTAEEHFRDWNGIWDTKSAGIDPVEGRIMVTQELIDWADLVVCMESVHAEYIKTYRKCDPRKLRVLNVADRYFRNDPELIRELERKVTPLLAE